MKVLFIGGTGNISSSASKLAVEKGFDLYLLHRGNATILGAKTITGNINSDISALLKEHVWDVVVNWIAFTKEDIERDIKLFLGKTKQYIFISSASAYQKPLKYPVITESTPLSNPYWEYSRNKINCEECLMQEYNKNGFPVTIVRPSLTYETVIPAAIGCWNDFTLIDRIRKGKKIIVHGDGSSLWTITHSKDFAKGFVGLLGNKKAIGQAFHITSDEILTWNQIYDAIAKAAGTEANIVHIPTDFIIKCDESKTGTLLGDKSVSVIFDNSKIKSFVPSYKSIIPFTEGIKNTVKWFEEDVGRMKIVKENNDVMDVIISKFEAL